jgi:hypothetical protein
MRRSEYQAMITSTIMFLILPLLSIYGLIHITHLLFSTVSTDSGSPTDPTMRDSIDITLPDWLDNTTTNPYSLNLTNRQLTFAKISVVSLWLLVVLSIILWVGKATRLYCFP